MKNPLLEKHALPPFTQIQPEHIVPAMSTLMERNLSTIDALANKPNPAWETLIEPIEGLEDELSQAWSPVSHLNSVANTPDIRKAYNECLPKLTDYGTQLGQHQALYQAYNVIAKSEAFSTLSKAQQKTISDALRDFKLSGVALNEKDREAFATLSKALSESQSQFQDNVMDATDNFHLDITDAKELEGVPEQAIAAAKAKAEKANVTGYRLTLDFPCYHAIITYAKHRELREKMHYAFNTRASDKGEKADWDNSALIEKIISLRHEQAALLGYASSADVSLVPKMAKSPEQVMSFLKEIAEKARPFAKNEFDALVRYIRDNSDIQTPEPWDIPYYSEKLKQSLFSISDEELRPYFPVDKVIQGMFDVVGRLYGISIRQVDNKDVWCDEVRFYEILDKHGELRGKFYLDLFARPKKRGGAWMDEARVRRKTIDGSVNYPVAYLTCNFSAPVGETPSLLTFLEVETLFHEFGHGLHHMLTKIDVPEVSGINGVAWDGVELPSQFLENWCWQEEALPLFSGHYKTGEPLPKSLLDKLQQAKHFQSGMKMLRQVEFSLFDFRLHLEFDPSQKVDAAALLKRIQDEYSVVPIAPYARFQHSFTHIFAGGYAAGYYSYLWAEVLACDAFSRFEEEGIFNPQTGQSFLENILEKGGSEEMDVLFRDFRGRDPDVSHLLRHHQLEE